MSVYVDDMARSARVKGRFSTWSHLLADDPSELARFAELLGLHPGWVQHPGTPREHYDLTRQLRLAAIRLGAVSIRYPQETAAFIAARRQGTVFDVAAHRQGDAA
jgi:hypothetical protein